MTPARRAAAAVIAAATLLAACGQKGPLFLPAAKGPAATAPAPARVPSATEDRVPPAPQVPPMPADQPVPAPTGVTLPAQ